MSAIIPSILDFGVTRDGLDVGNQNAVKINAAISATSGELYFPIGTYLINDPILLSNTTVLVGSGVGSTRIIQNDQTKSILKATASQSGFRELSFEYSAIPATTVPAVLISSSLVKGDNFRIINPSIGLEAGLGSKLSAFTNFRINDFSQNGIYVHNTNDVFFDKFTVDAGVHTVAGNLGGIRLYNFCEAIMFSNGDVLEGKFALTMGADTPLNPDGSKQNIQGRRPAYCTFTNVYFDSATYTNLIDQVVETEFVGCWFSGGRADGGNPGLILSETDSIRFTNTKFFNNGGHGCLVQGASKRTAFTACSFESNSQTAADGARDGLYVQSGATQVSVIGSKFGNGLYYANLSNPSATHQQGYGITLENGVVEPVIIGNTFGKGSFANKTGAIRDLTTGTIKQIIGNSGYVDPSDHGTTAIAFAAGLATLSHGIGVDPTFISASVKGAPAGIVVDVTGSSPTTLSLRLIDSATKALVTGSYWITWKVEA